eukprot:TRINITY_DN50_c1_g1_i1.p1 TRINITY_DN50_c1_g1~~TRINITY_DN50_c1_g1_i1.p1  ORF type:complete len:2411 (+),score=707.03 TRINITY_DN50_c1_g1_i1:1502-8734(+)
MGSKEEWRQVQHTLMEYAIRRQKKKILIEYFSDALPQSVPYILDLLELQASPDAEKEEAKRRSLLIDACEQIVEECSHSGRNDGDGDESHLNITIWSKPRFYSEVAHYLRLSFADTYFVELSRVRHDVFRRRGPSANVRTHPLSRLCVHLHGAIWHAFMKDPYRDGFQTSVIGMRYVMLLEELEDLFSALDVVMTIERDLVIERVQEHGHDDHRHGETSDGNQSERQKALSALHCDVMTTMYRLLLLKGRQELWRKVERTHTEKVSELTKKRSMPHVFGKVTKVHPAEKEGLTLPRGSRRSELALIDSCLYNKQARALLLAEISAFRDTLGEKEILLRDAIKNLSEFMDAKEIDRKNPRAAHDYGCFELLRSNDVEIVIRPKAVEGAIGFMCFAKTSSNGKTVNRNNKDIGGTGVIHLGAQPIIRLTGIKRNEEYIIGVQPYFADGLFGEIIGTNGRSVSAFQSLPPEQILAHIFRHGFNENCVEFVRGISDDMIHVLVKNRQSLFALSQCVGADGGEGNESGQKRSGAVEPLWLSNPILRRVFADSSAEMSPAVWRAVLPMLYIIGDQEIQPLLTKDLHSSSELRVLASANAYYLGLLAAIQSNDPGSVIEAAARLYQGLVPLLKARQKAHFAVQPLLALCLALIRGIPQKFILTIEVQRFISCALYEVVLFARQNSEENLLAKCIELFGEFLKRLHEENARFLVANPESMSQIRSESKRLEEFLFELSPQSCEILLNLEGAERFLQKDFMKFFPILHSSEPQKTIEHLKTAEVVASNSFLPFCVRLCLLLYRLKDNDSLLSFQSFVKGKVHERFEDLQEAPISEVVDEAKGGRDVAPADDTEESSDDEAREAARREKAIRLIVSVIRMAAKRSEIRRKRRDMRQKETPWRAVLEFLQGLAMFSKILEAEHGKDHSNTFEFLRVIPAVEEEFVWKSQKNKTKSSKSKYRKHEETNVVDGTGAEEEDEAQAEEDGDDKEEVHKDDSQSSVMTEREKKLREAMTCIARGIVFAGRSQCWRMVIDGCKIMWNIAKQSRDCTLPCVPLFVAASVMIEMVEMIRNGGSLDMVFDRDVLRDLEIQLEELQDAKHADDGRASRCITSLSFKTAKTEHDHREQEKSFDIDMPFVSRFIVLSCQTLYICGKLNRCVSVASTFDKLTSHRFALDVLPAAQHAAEAASLSLAGVIRPIQQQISISIRDIPKAIMSLKRCRTRVGEYLVRTYFSETRKSPLMTHKTVTLDGEKTDEGQEDTSQPVINDKSGFEIVANDLETLVQEYQACVKVLRSKHEMEDLPSALSELGDLAFMQGAKELSKSCYCDAVDACFEKLRANTEWREIWSKKRGLVLRLGVKRLLLAISCIGKLLNSFSSVLDSQERLEYGILGVAATMGIFSTSIVHPQRPCDFKLYRARELLFDTNEDVFGCYYDGAAETVLHSLVLIAKVLMNEMLHVLSLPVLTMAETIAMQVVRDVRQTVQTRTLKAESLTRCGYFREASVILSEVYSGRYLPERSTGRVVDFLEKAEMSGGKSESEFRNDLLLDDEPNKKAMESVAHFSIHQKLERSYGEEICAHLQTVKAWWLVSLLQYRALRAKKDAYVSNAYDAIESSLNMLKGYTQESHDQSENEGKVAKAPAGKGKPPATAGGKGKTAKEAASKQDSTSGGGSEKTTKSAEKKYGIPLWVPHLYASIRVAQSVFFEMIGDISRAIGSLECGSSIFSMRDEDESNFPMYVRREISRLLFVQGTHEKCIDECDQILNRAKHLGDERTIAIVKLTQFLARVTEGMIDPEEMPDTIAAIVEEMRSVHFIHSRYPVALLSIAHLCEQFHLDSVDRDLLVSEASEKLCDALDAYGVQIRERREDLFVRYIPFYFDTIRAKMELAQLFSMGGHVREAVVHLDDCLRIGRICSNPRHPLVGRALFLHGRFSKELIQRPHVGGDAQWGSILLKHNELPNIDDAISMAETSSGGGSSGASGGKKGDDKKKKGGPADVGSGKQSAAKDGKKEKGKDEGEAEKDDDDHSDHNESEEDEGDLSFLGSVRNFERALQILIDGASFDLDLIRKILLEFAYLYGTKLVPEDKDTHLRIAWYCLVRAARLQRMDECWKYDVDALEHASVADLQGGLPLFARREILESHEVGASALTPTSVLYYLIQLWRDMETDIDPLSNVLGIEKVCVLHRFLVENSKEFRELCALDRVPDWKVWPISSETPGISQFLPMGWSSGSMIFQWYRIGASQRMASRQVGRMSRAERMKRKQEGLSEDVPAVSLFFALYQEMPANESEPELKPAFPLMGMKTLEAKDVIRIQQKVADLIYGIETGSITKGMKDGEESSAGGTESVVLTDADEWDDPSFWSELFLSLGSMVDPKILDLPKLSLKLLFSVKNMLNVHGGHMWTDPAVCSIFRAALCPSSPETPI